MEKIYKILCPVDFSTVSENTVKYAISFGKQYGIEPEILHVSTKPPEVYYRFFPDITGYLKAIEEDTESQLNKFIQKIDTQLKSTIRYGTIYQEIIQFAQEEHIDLIIISASGFSTSDQRSLGTTAQKIIHKADCPVLTVYGRKTQANIKKILCPVDLSPQSYQGLFRAADLARKFDAQIYLLHVVELYDFKKSKIKKFASTKSFSKLGEQLQQEIEIPPAIKDIAIEKVIRRNMDAAEEIASFAAENQIDIITLTTHSRSYLPRVLLGSVTEKVAHIAPCPVLILRLIRRFK